MQGMAIDEVQNPDKHPSASLFVKETVIRIIACTTHSSEKTSSAETSLIAIQCTISCPESNEMRNEISVRILLLR